MVAYNVITADNNLDHTKKGILTVVYGDNARREAVNSLFPSIRTYQAHLPIIAISDRVIPQADQTRIFNKAGWGARWAKLNQNLLSPWDQWLYLDADTQIKGDLSPGFQILADGWDLVIVASRYQQDQWLWMASQQEREYTQDPCPLTSLQGGVFFCRRNQRTDIFFEHWRDEWMRFKQIDQGALIRAIQKAQIRIWLLGGDYNDGSLIKHHFGRARDDLTL